MFLQKLMDFLDLSEALRKQAQGLLDSRSAKRADIVRMGQELDAYIEEMAKAH